MRSSRCGPGRRGRSHPAVAVWLTGRNCSTPDFSYLGTVALNERRKTLPGIGIWQLGFPKILIQIQDDLE